MEFIWRCSFSAFKTHISSSKSDYASETSYACVLSENTKTQPDETNCAKIKWALKVIKENFLHWILEYKQLYNKQDEKAGKVV